MERHAPQTRCQWEDECPQPRPADYRRRRATRDARVCGLQGTARAVSTTTETLNLPTSASGSITFAPGESQTVVTSVTFTPSALSAAATSVTVPTSAELTLTGYVPCEIPTAFQFEIEPLAVTKAPVTAKVSGGSITFTTDTVSVLACRNCPPEE